MEEYTTYRNITYRLYSGDIGTAERMLGILGRVPDCMERG